MSLTHAPQASAAAEGRCFVITMFDCFLFLIVLLLTFINVGLGPDDEIPWFWYGSLVHGLMIIAHFYLIGVFMSEKTANKLLIVENPLRQNPTGYISHLQSVRPLICQYHMWIVLAFMVVSLGADGAVYVTRTINATECAYANGGSACVFVNAGVFMDYLGAVCGLLLVVSDVISIAYLYGYRASIKTEYLTKSTVQKDALNPDANIEFTQQDDRVPPSLRQRSLQM